MLDFRVEKNLFRRGYKLVGAIDEAGRGPLAGPVVAACLIFPVDFSIAEELRQVNDSKKISAFKREKLYDIIKSRCLELGIGSCDNQTIDKINILQASFLAMKKAIGQLKKKPEYLIIDGRFKIPNCSIPQTAFVRGDERIFSIAAASIMAKVTRDRLMQTLHRLYPNYGFDLHKGYGTALHLECLKRFGPCPIHRLSFRSVKP